MSIIILSDALQNSKHLLLKDDFNQTAMHEVPPQTLIIDYSFFSRVY